MFVIKNMYALLSIANTINLVLTVMFLNESENRYETKYFFLCHCPKGSHANNSKT